MYCIRAFGYFIIALFHGINPAWFIHFSDIVSATMSTKPITFSRSQDGWFFKEDKIVRYSKSFPLSLNQFIHLNHFKSFYKVLYYIFVAPRTEMQIFPNCAVFWFFSFKYLHLVLRKISDHMLPVFTT